MTSSRFRAGVTSGAADEECRTRKNRLARAVTMAGYLAFHPKSEIRRQLAQDGDERTDAIGAVEQESEDGWVARWVIAERQEGFVVRRLLLEPVGVRTPPGGITARLLRELSPTNALSAFTVDPQRVEVDPLLADEIGSTDGMVASPTHIFIGHGRSEVEKIPADGETKRVGRPRLPGHILAAVAEAYLEELPHGRGLLERISHRPEISRPVETVRDWVRVARRQDFLTQTIPGRRGAGPGPALLAYRESDKQS